MQNRLDELSNLFRVYLLFTWLPWSKHFGKQNAHSHVRLTRDRMRNFCATNCLIGHLVTMRTSTARSNQIYFLLLTACAKLHPQVCIAKNTTVALQNYTMALQKLEPCYCAFYMYIESPPFYRMVGNGGLRISKRHRAFYRKCKFLESVEHIYSYTELCVTGSNVRISTCSCH